MMSAISSVFYFLLRDIPKSMLQFVAGIILVAGIRNFIVFLVLVGGAAGLVISKYGAFEPPATIVSSQEVNLSGLADATKLILLKNNTHCKLSSVNSMTCTNKEKLQ